MPVPSWVPEQFRPTERQSTMWMDLVFVEDGTTAEGWWIGWCPLHDQVRDPQHATAQFNFQKDVYRCTNDEPCHAPKRAMSLTNLKTRMTQASRDA